MIGLSKFSKNGTGCLSKINPLSTPIKRFIYLPRYANGYVLIRIGLKMNSPYYFKYIKLSEGFITDSQINNTDSQINNTDSQINNTDSQINNTNNPSLNNTDNSSLINTNSSLNNIISNLNVSNDLIIN